MTEQLAGYKVLLSYVNFRNDNSQYTWLWVSVQERYIITHSVKTFYRLLEMCIAIVLIDIDTCYHPPNNQLRYTALSTLYGS